MSVKVWNATLTTHPVKIFELHHSWRSQIPHCKTKLSTTFATKKPPLKSLRNRSSLFSLITINQSAKYKTSSTFKVKQKPHRRVPHLLWHSFGLAASPWHWKKRRWAAQQVTSRKVNRKTMLSVPSSRCTYGRHRRRKHPVSVQFEPRALFG